MERNPKEYKKMQYYRSILYRKIRPLFFWERCDKCGNEFRRETMYEVEIPSIIGFPWRYYKHGCSKCFLQIDDFKEWCKQEILLKEEDFEDERKILF